MKEATRNVLRFRCDGQKGWERVVPTTNHCLFRVKVYTPRGKLDRTYLEDKAGGPFMDDMPNVIDNQA